MVALTHSESFSQSITYIDGKLHYALTPPQVDFVLTLAADLVASEAREAELTERIADRDSVIEVLTLRASSQDAIDTAQQDVITIRGERLETRDNDKARANARKVWDGIKSAWKEVTIAVSAAGLGYAVGYITAK